jgi:thymidylate synthase
MSDFATFSDAMSHAANKIMTEGKSVPGVCEPTSVGSFFGKEPRPTKEIIGFTFSLTDPTAVLVDRPSRPINAAFSLANILWTASGSDRVADIAFWNSRAYDFSDDKETVRSALGPRLFTNQFATAINRLRADPGTRRAFLSLISANDLTDETRDVPCTIGLHLMIRDSALTAVAMMRSQSALMVLPYDIPLLAAIQCMAAAELEIPPGPLTHISSSLHFYLDETDIATQVARGQIRSVSVPDIPKLEEMKDLALFESKLRQASQEELFSIASDLVAEPKSHGYSTVVRSSLLLHLLSSGPDYLRLGLRALAGEVGGLVIGYQRRGMML